MNTSSIGSKIENLSDIPETIQRGLLELFGIRSIPSLLFIPMGEKPKMQVGAMGKAQFQEVINEHLLK